MSKPLRVLFTCEHSGNAIPAAYREVARRAGNVLRTHRGYDPGTLALGRQLARHFAAPLIAARYSRLLVELNRSPGHHALWSEFTRNLSPPEKARVLASYYHPHRDAVENAVAERVGQGAKVLHVGLHSFTPVLHEEVRRTEIGLLYDPSRSLEKRISARWKESIRHIAPDWRVRMNYPYRGVADGLVTYLRKRFPNSQYAGLELEVNQTLVLGKPEIWKETRIRLVESLDWVRRG